MSPWSRRQGCLSNKIRMILPNQLYISVDNSRTHTRQRRQIVYSKSTADEQLDTLIVPNVMANAALSMVGSPGDDSLIDTLFIKGNDLGFMGWANTLVKVVAFGQERLIGQASSFGQQQTQSSVSSAAAGAVGALVVLLCRVAQWPRLAHPQATKLARPG